MYVCLYHFVVQNGENDCEYGVDGREDNTLTTVEDAIVRLFLHKSNYQARYPPKYICKQTLPARMKSSASFKNCCSVLRKKTMKKEA